MTDRSCFIGIQLDEECHKTTYCRTSGFKSLSDLESSDRHLLEWRTGIVSANTDRVCFHHEKVYLSRYESLQKFCCDPDQIHNKRVRSKLIFIFYSNRIFCLILHINTDTVLMLPV